ncbi:MAG: DUF4236 domain-containing protein [Eubacteriales bacterium]|nr:DUF4236 domain-containing protein [Eubacteriales bacterium]
MGLRARKSIKIAPGVKVNIGKKSVGVSVGGKHDGVSVNSKKGVNTRASIPGTGISYTNHVSSKKAVQPRKQPSKASPLAFRAWGILLIITSAACIGTGIYISESVSPFLPYLFGGFCGFFGLIYLIISFTRKE